jgi:hypothetical protein
MRDIMQIAMTLAGIATLALVIRESSNVSKLVTTGAASYAGLLQAATGQGTSLFNRL